MKIYFEKDGVEIIVMPDKKIDQVLLDEIIATFEDKGWTFKAIDQTTS